MFSVSLITPQMRQPRAEYGLGAGEVAAGSGVTAVVGGEGESVRRPEEQREEFAVYATEKSPLAGFVSPVSRLVCTIDMHDHPVSQVGSLQSELRKETKVGVCVSRERGVGHRLPIEHFSKSEQDLLCRYDD